MVLVVVILQRLLRHVRLQGLVVIRQGGQLKSHGWYSLEEKVR
jgi:hypothetical protein